MKKEISSIVRVMCLVFDGKMRSSPDFRTRYVFFVHMVGKNQVRYVFA